MTRPHGVPLLATAQRSGRCPFEPADELNALREKDDLPVIAAWQPMSGPVKVRAVTRYADVRAAFADERVASGIAFDPEGPRTLFNQQFNELLMQ